MVDVQLVGLVFVAALVILAMWRPALALLVYAVVAADADGFGVQHFISTAFPEYLLLTRGVYLALGVWAAVQLTRAAGQMDPRVRQMAALGAALGVWVVVSSLLKGLDVVSALSLLVYTGLPALLVWLTAGRRPEGRKLFLGFVLLQIAISVGTLVNPAMRVVDGATYSGMAHLGQGVNLAVPTDETLKLVVGSHYGQFHNPNVLGFYAAVALACGFALLRYSRPWTRALAGVFAVLGAIGWLNSLTRGVILGLLAAAVVVIATVWRVSDRRQALMRALVVTIAAGTAVAVALLAPSTLGYLVPEATDVSVRYRLSGYDNGFTALGQHPWLGVGTDWDWAEGGVPHFLGLWFAGQYGIPGGILVVLASFGMGGVVIARAVRGARTSTITEGRATLAVALVLVVWGIAITNNLAAPVLFWVCLAEAMIITTPSESAREPALAAGRPLGVGRTSPGLRSASPWLPTTSHRTAGRHPRGSEE